MLCEKRMNIKTKGGIAEGLPLSDVQEYNLQLRRNTKAIYLLAWLIIFLFIFIFWYLKHYNIVGYPVSILRTIAERCV